MIDINICGNAGDHTSFAKPEFFRIELSALQDGAILVSLTATTVDDDEPELLDQEIARECVATIEDVLDLVRAHVRVVQVSESHSSYAL